MHVHSACSDVLVCQLQNKAGHVDSPSTFYNPFIASLVTSYSRQVITNFMRPIGCGNPYYLDTDSLFYKKDPAYTNPPPVDKNKLLGSLVSEIDDNQFIKVGLLNVRYSNFINS